LFRVVTFSKKGAITVIGFLGEKKSRQEILGKPE
jgi:hypothetical protein